MNPLRFLTVLCALAFPVSAQTNLLTNGDFEKDNVGDTPAGWVKWTRNPSTFEVIDGGRDSKRCASVTLIQTSECPFVLADQWVRVPIAAGERYRASCYVRADKPVRVSLWLYGGAKGLELRRRTDVIASQAWREVSVEMQVPAGEFDAEPYLRFALAMDQLNGANVQFDDARLVKLPDDAPAPESTNLVNNPRFEQGDVGASPTNWRWWTRNPSTFAVATAGRTGRSAKLRLVKNETCGFLLADQYIETPLSEGDHVRARAWVRADKPTPVTLRLYGGAPGVDLVGRGDLTANDQWQPIAASFDVPALNSAASYIRFTLALSSENVDVFVDDVEVINVRGPAAAKQALPQLVFAADRYHTGAGLPLRIGGKPVGASGTLDVTLPDDFDATHVPLASLWLDLDDIDAPAETGIYINGQGPIRATSDMCGEGAGFSGSIPFEATYLNPGRNEIKFVFESDLNGTTSGFAILDAKLLTVRPGPAKPRKRVRSDGMLTTITMPGIGTIIADNVASQSITVNLPRGDEFGWQNSPIRKGDGHGGFVSHPAQTLMLTATKGKYIMPFGIHEMDNGEIIIGASWHDGEMELPVISISSDGGKTFSDWQTVPNAFDRPMMFTYLGKGELFFATRGFHHYSHDYGRTWPDKLPEGAAGNGSQFWAEGNMHVDLNPDGTAKRVFETGGNLGGKPIFQEGSYTYIRWSDDGGKTWQGNHRPAAWIYDDNYKGKTYKRSVSEGGLVRANDGNLVAALRTDMPRHFLDGPHNDGLEGIAVSISKDDGLTWSKLNHLYKAGRHHCCLVKRPNGDLVMTYVVRINVKDGKLIDHRRGMEAIISKDNGLTWNTSEAYILDEYKYVNPHQWYDGKCGHVAAAALKDGSILSIYGNYLAKSAVLVRWTP